MNLKHKILISLFVGLLSIGELYSQSKENKFENINQFNELRGLSRRESGMKVHVTSGVTLGTYNSSNLNVSYGYSFYDAIFFGLGSGIEYYFNRTEFTNIPVFINMKFYLGAWYFGFQLGGYYSIMEDIDASGFHCNFTTGWRVKVSDNYNLEFSIGWAAQSGNNFISSGFIMNIGIEL